MEFSFIKALLLDTGQILKNDFGASSKFQPKQDQSNVVTESDFKSEEFIRKIISEKFPAHNILGEEHGFEDKQSEFTWIVDPLDGTSNFAAQLPWFGVLIALQKHHEIILSGAYLPMTNELYLASKGGGAYKNGQQVQVTSEQDFRNLLCCYSLDFSIDPHKTKREVEIIESLVHSCRNLRSTNCLIDFCYVSDGRLGAAINQTMKIWDIAAPQLIIEEAGGKVTDIKGQKIIYKPSKSSATTNYTAVAASQTTHEKIMDLLYPSKSMS